MMEKSKWGLSQQLEASPHQKGLNFYMVLTCSKSFEDIGHRWCFHCHSGCARADTSDRWTDRSGSGMTLGDNPHSWAVPDGPGTSLLGSPYSWSVHQYPGTAPEDTEHSPIVLSHSGMFRVNIHSNRMSQSRWQNDQRHMLCS